LQLEPHVERQEVARRHHDHHAHDRQRHEDRILETQDPPPLHVVLAHQQHGGRREQDHHLGEAREGVVDEHAAEGRDALVAPEADHEAHEHEDG
jgi:hypothetical protein